MSRRLDYTKRLDVRDVDRIYQDSPSKKLPRTRLRESWRETRSGGFLSNWRGLKLLAVRDKFDLSRWVFYRMPPNNRSGKIVRSSANYASLEEAKTASRDFTQKVIPWDYTKAAFNVTKNYPPKPSKFD